MVGESGFEPPSPWSRTRNRCTNLLSRLGLFCVLYHPFPRYQEANGPKLDPSLGLKKTAMVQFPYKAAFSRSNTLEAHSLFALLPQPRSGI